MFCGNCGAQMPEQAKFCTKCGFRFQTQTAASPGAEQPFSPGSANSQGPVNQMPGNLMPGTDDHPPVYRQPPANYQPPAYSRPLPNTQPAGTPGQAPGFAALRKLSCSALLLIALIALTLSALAAAAAQIDSLATLGNLINLSQGDTSSEVRNTLQAMSGFRWVVFLVTLVLSGLTVVGGWMTFAEASKPNTGRRSTVGLSMIKAAKIVELVIFCVGFLLTALFLAAAGNEVNSLLLKISTLHARSDMRPYFSILNVLGELSAFRLFLLSIVFTVLGIAYYVCVFVTINVISGTMKSGVPNPRVPVLVPVLNFLMALVLLLIPFAVTEAAELMEEIFDDIIVRGGTGRDVMELFGADTQTVLISVGSVCTAVCLVFFGAFLLQYRKTMCTLPSEGTGPVYGNPRY